MKEQKNISIIVAIASNQAIGKDNDLLWHISADLKRFKRITEGNPVIMGKRTYYSLPRRPLPNRLNMVLTDVPGETIDGCVMAYTIEEAIEKMPVDKENFIIGGGSIYRQFMPKANRLYITRVLKDFDADTFFPEISVEEWELVSEEKVTGDPQNEFDYTFEVYTRKY
jgi:dihydrofolate reductase